MSEFLIGLSDEDATFLARIIIGFVVCLGAIIGSFLNVCIYRIPLGQSVSTPRSHCFGCGKVIPWYYNVPILAWFVLRGKCANCKSSISFRYPLIEALTAILFLLVFQMWGNPRIFGLNPLPIPELIPFFWLFVASTVVNIMIDIDHRILLDRISIGGTLLTFFASSAYPILHGEMTWGGGLLASFYGACVGFGVGFLIAFVGERIFLQDAFGFGDVKWMMLFGALFGWYGLLWIMLMASLLGLIIGVAVLLHNKLKRLSDDAAIAIPFGPALGSAALIWLFWGNAVLRHCIHAYAWLLSHENLMLWVILPLLLLTTIWLIIRIRLIRKWNREAAETMDVLTDFPQENAQQQESDDAR